MARGLLAPVLPSKTGGKPTELNSDSSPSLLLITWAKATVEHPALTIDCRSENLMPEEGEQVISQSQIWQRYTQLLSHIDLEIFIVWVHIALGFWSVMCLFSACQ